MRASHGTRPDVTIFIHNGAPPPALVGCLARWERQGNAYRALEARALDMIHSQLKQVVSTDFKLV